MESAFGVDHGVSKGLPSALRGAKTLKPGSYGALRRGAHQEGKYAAKVGAWEKATPMGRGKTTLRWQAGQTRNAGRHLAEQRKRVLP
jgi:hypothetical protein